MSQLIVLTFDDKEQAGQAFNAIKKAQRSGYVKVVDAAVVVKNESGKVEVKHQLDEGVKWGAVGGGVLGLLFAGVFFPLAGLTVGAVGGALVGKALDLGVDKRFVNEVTETLKPGMSALFVIGSSDNPDAINGLWRPFQGTVYQTTLSEEALETLRDALKRKE